MSVLVSRHSNSSVSERMSPELQVFHRYEFKYLLNAETSELIENEVEQFMRYDGHVDPTMDNMYFVRSLYYDDPFSSAFYEKTDGVMIRQKFRIRTYGKTWNKNTPIFLESKGRHNERTYKHRIDIAHKDLEYLLLSQKSWDLLDLFPHSKLIQKFVFDTHRKKISPRVLVDYIRKPYVSDYDSNFRATFDRMIESRPSLDLFPSQENVSVKCYAGWTILEIKFDRRLPKWFHRILQNHEMRRLSVSKFCLGMEYCGIAEDKS